MNAEDSSVDAVVTFRNVHNWMGSNTEASSFELFFDALKPGGILGVVEHRAPAGTDKATMQKSGYMTQDYVIEIARDAGFLSRHPLRSMPTKKTLQIILRAFDSATKLELRRS